MIELRTLGAVDLRSPGGAEIRAVLQQPKRLALLVYLATASPGKLHRRDSLLALFWPDLDQAHARAALRRALYFLRQALGADLIVGRGDEEVGLDAERVWCDALEFDRALDRDDLATGLDLYQGDFLAGFYVQGAPEAEAWFDRERSRRRYEAALGGWQLARRALPDAAVAGRWAGLAIELAPSDQDAVLSFLQELERRGDRSLALRVFEMATERLQTELGIAPHPELAAAAARIAAAGPAPTGPAPALAPRPRDRYLVAVCPFAVRGDPALAYLGEGMVDLLGTKLDGTGALRTVDPRPLMARTGSIEAGGVDPIAGIKIAEQLGAGLFVIGTLIASGGRLEAGVGLYDAGGKLQSRAEGRSPNEAGLFELVDDLVRQLVADYDRSAAGRLARLAALTTESLPALKAYLAGEHEFRLGRHLQALDLFRRATREDPSFALGYYRLASTLAANALIGPARQASAEAYRHRGRLTDHDRLLLEAQHAWLGGRTADAERRYAALTLSFPEQLDAWYLLGDLLFHNNPYRGRSVTEAKEAFQRALAIDQSHFGALTQLARIAALENQRDELNRYVTAALHLSPAADQAQGLRILQAFAAGSRADQDAAVQDVRTGSGLVIARAFTDVALYVRDLEGAERLAQAVLPEARSPEFAAIGRIVLAHLQMALGKTAEAMEQLREAGRLEPAWALELRCLFATLPDSKIPETECAEIERELEAWDPETATASVAVPLIFHDGLHPHFRYYLKGLLAVRRRDAAALRLAANGLSDLGVPDGAEVLAEQLGRTLDAEALRLEGRPAAALAALERLATDVWFQFAVGSPFFAGTHHRFLRADLLQQLGRAEEAIGWWRTIAQRSPYELVFSAAAAARIAQAAAPAPHTGTR